MSAALVSEAEDILGHRFRDTSLIERALTHPSAVGGRADGDSYERLEFLGDAVLGAIVAHELYRDHPDMREGELTRLKIALISGETLARAAEELGLGACIAFGAAEQGTEARGRQSALENVFEAVVGALYIDGGYDLAHEFVVRALADEAARSLEVMPESPKSLLQEITQRDFRITPTYEVVGQEGPAHDPVFVAVAKLDGRRVGRGQGRSKKAAESEAARDAIERIERDPAAFADGALA